MAVKRTYLSNDLEGVYEIIEALENIKYSRGIINSYFEFEEYAEQLETLEKEIDEELEEFKDMLAAHEKAEEEAINNEYMRSIGL